MYTKKPDKKIEYSFLKTINAFLNTDGGILLVGVSDDGTILGVEKDEFKNNDKFYQHFTNLIKNHIGNEHLLSIKSNIIEIDKKNILKIDCNTSNKEVFLKVNDVEEFYVRTGPASVKLNGSKLITYVNQKFKHEVYSKNNTKSYTVRHSDIDKLYCSKIAARSHVYPIYVQPDCCKSGICR